MSLINILKNRSLAEHLLRTGIAVSFLYPPLSAIGSPGAWIDYIPAYALAISPFSDLVLLHIFGVFEVIIGIWILFGKRVYIPASIAGLVLLYITFVYFEQFVVLFRDLALALASFALAQYNYIAANTIVSEEIQ